MPSHLILNCWWRDNTPKSCSADDLVATWRQQLTKPGVPSRRQQAAIRTVFDDLSRKSLQNALLVGRESLAAAEEDVRAAHASFNEHESAIARLEGRCGGLL
jgi:hypothetical protein